MVETKFHDEQGNEVQFIRKDIGQNSEITLIKHDVSGNFVSNAHYLYASDKLQEYSFFSENGELISKHIMEYCSNFWDAWQREFNNHGQLLKQTFYTWDNKYQAKAELYYGAIGEYLGKKIYVLQDGKRKILIFDRENNLV